MRFENSHILWLLLVVPPGAGGVFLVGAARAAKTAGAIHRGAVVVAVDGRNLAGPAKNPSGPGDSGRGIFTSGPGRPQRGFDLQEVEQRGLDIVVAVDTSKSMLAADIAPNRLVRAKLAALELMQRPERTRMGLVAFAGDAFLECPLTIDNTAFQQCVQALDVNAIPQRRHGHRRRHQRPR